jgi:hypothetical protein
VSPRETVAKLQTVVLAMATALGIEANADDLTANLKTITDLQSRLDALEATSHGGFGMPVCDAISEQNERLDALEAKDRARDHIEAHYTTFAGYRIGEPSAPTWVVEAFGAIPNANMHDDTIPPKLVAGTWADHTAKGAPKTISFNPMDEDATNGNALQYLLKCGARTIELAFGFSDDVNAMASPARMEALKTVRDRLKTMKAEIAKLKHEAKVAADDTQDDPLYDRWLKAIEALAGKKS